MTSVDGKNNDQSEKWLRDALGLTERETPFPWQIEMLRRFLNTEPVSALDIPTGLGKTATMAVWLVARALGAPLPRRLVYVVDRRVVVDQATEVAESLRAWVAKDLAVVNALGLGDRPLPISTLRGQHVDNKEWLEDPSCPAIVVGTIDMVGSRLLFSGYGVSSKMRPYHAGLLGADTLVVLDEAHLVPAFEDLLRQVERGVGSFGPNNHSLCGLVPPFKLLSLSATGRQTDATSLTLSDDDRRNLIVAKRLAAKKTLSIVELANVADAPAAAEGGKPADGAEENGGEKRKSKGPKLSNVLAKQAWELTAQGSEQVRCLVFCNSREDATAVEAELHNLAESAGAKEPTIELLVGGRRVKERIVARDALAHLGFLAGTAVPLERSAFLIATSAGEVGVDLDADHMVCDLVTWERMVQRLGRVNRRGDGDAKVVVVIDREPVASDKMRELQDRRDKVNQARSAISARERDVRLRLKELYVTVDETRSAIEQLQQQMDDERQQKPAGSKTPEQKEAQRIWKERRDALKRNLTAKKEEQREKQRQLEALEKSLVPSADEKRAIKAFKDGDAKVVARHEADIAKRRGLRTLLDAVLKDGGNLSPAALLNLRSRQDVADALRAATAVEPLRPELTRALVDAWSMTSLDEHPGRPEVEPWLRGFRPNDPPQTTVVWRRHLPVRADESFDAKAAKRFFEAAPLHTSEQLEIETHLVLDWLIERAAAVSEAKDTEAVLNAEQVVVIALGARGEVKGWRTLNQIAGLKGKGKSQDENKEAKKDREQAEEELKKLLVGTTLVIDARLGGLTDGLLNKKASTPANVSDDGATTWLARPNALEVSVTGFRIRVLGTSEEVESARHTTQGAGWVRRYLFVTKLVDSESSAALVIDGWAGDAATEEERAEADRPQQLDEHQHWAEGCAREIAKRLGLEKARTDLLALAARLHDEGKRAARWQRAFNAPIDGGPYAKTRGPIHFGILDGYRHELGSLRYVEAHADFKALNADDQDFVLHLIAAHHGFARPVIGTSGCDDPPSIADERARVVALRFARLSRRWGPWGLAWWEVLLRAADQMASRRNQRAATLKERA